MAWAEKIRRALQDPRQLTASRYRRGTGRPRICIVSDVRDWAFDLNAHDIAAALADDFAFSHFYVADWISTHRADWDDYDVIYELFHRNPAMGIPMERAIGALRCEWFKAESPAPPDENDIATVNRYRAFQVAVRRNYEELQDRCPRVVYLTNPINTDRFAPTSTRSSIVASWNGNAGHSSRGRPIKHFWDIVVPACATARVPLVAAEYGTSEGPMRRRAPRDMPAFYQTASVALCASEYEAASFSVMEAMASGLALLATDVGNHREMRDSQLTHFGDTGIQLVEPSVEAFAEALRALQPAQVRRMGEINRAEIIARWSWTAWRDRYRAFFLQGLSQS